MNVRDEVRAIVSEHATAPDDDAAPLEVDSLAIVQIVEALEDRVGIRVAPREVTPEAFRSIASLVALVEAKRR
jgi:acyl carrier protein